MLLQATLEWAVRDSILEWIDLEVVAGNTPAIALYRDAGFEEVASVPDMFHIEGLSVGHLAMTRRLRPCAASE